jgi:Helix-turn-helix domain
MPDRASRSLEALVPQLLSALREEMRSAVAAELAPMRAAIDALAGGAAIGPISLDAAAPVLGKSVATLRRLAGAGKLPGAMRIGRSWRIDLGAVRPPRPEQIADLAAEARRS